MGIATFFTPASKATCKHYARLSTGITDQYIHREFDNRWGAPGETARGGHGRDNHEVPYTDWQSGG